MIGYSRSKEDYREILIKKFLYSKQEKMEDKELLENENNARDYGDEYAFWDNVEFDIPEIKHDIRPKTNQGSNTTTKSACTMIGALNQIIRLFGIDLDLVDSNRLWIEVVNYCVENGGYKIGYGWSTPTAINCVCKFWNEIGSVRYNTDKVFYVRHYWNSDRPKEALEKGHLVGFTYHLNFGEDRKKGLVYKDSYPAWGGHRTNRQSTKTTKATGGAKEPSADCGVYDSYYGGTNQYLIMDRSKYINKGMYARAYLIMPQWCMKKTVEEVKKEIKEEKAVNALIWVMSSTYGEIPNEFQLMSSAYATALRDRYEGARPLESDGIKKTYQMVVDVLSYAWKYADEEEQKTYAELAKHLRDKFGLK